RKFCIGGLVMKRILCSGVGAFALILASQPGGAADIPTKAPVYKAPPIFWGWAGLYIGTHSGAAVSTSTFSDPFGPSIYGDDVTPPGYLVGGQIGYNWQNWAWVYGIEADASWVKSFGSNTCLAFSGNFVSANCKAEVRAIGTITGRLGQALGPDGRTL